MTSSDTVLVSDPDEDGIAVVTLNRPAALNATDDELHGAIASVWVDLAQLAGLRAVVLTGAGSAFCAGGDLALLEQMVDDRALRRKSMDEAALLVRSVVAFPYPIVAAVNGAAVGLGCSLASLADLVVMEEHAYLADPHVALGLVAGDGVALTWPLTMGLQRAKEWLLLGGRMSARQALEYGLANQVVPAGRSVDEACQLAHRLAALPPQALRETRRLLDQPLARRVEEALDDALAAETRSFDEPAFQQTLARVRERRGA